MTDWERYNLDQLAIGENRSWILSVRSIQITLGSCRILTKRRVERLSELSNREAVDLRDMVRAFEDLLTGCFQPARFNYVISGQHGVMSREQDPLLHLHAFPRYNRNVYWRNRDWVDRRWPKFLRFPEVSENPIAELRSLRTLLRDEAVGRRLLEKHDQRRL